MVKDHFPCLREHYIGYVQNVCQDPASIPGWTAHTIGFGSQCFRLEQAVRNMYHKFSCLLQLYDKSCIVKNLV